MSQRNPMNERYTTTRQGQTRKSAASAKPKSERAATLRDPAPKTRKQKKLERKEREAKRDAKMQKRVSTTKARYEDTQEYRHLRHIWWGLLIAAIICTAVAFFLNSQPETLSSISAGELSVSISVIFMVGAYAFIIAAFYIDFSRIRKGRGKFEARTLNDTSKEARAKQKQLRAEAREKAREEATRAQEEAENPVAPPKGIKGFLSRIKPIERIKKPEDSKEDTSSETK